MTSVEMPDPKLFALLVGCVQDYAISLLDPAGRVMSWNAGAERITQYTADEIVGKHFSIFYTANDRERNWPQTELDETKKEGRFEDEGWRIKKDASRFWANVIITALRDNRGELLGFSKITRDLTDRKTHEEALRQSEERFRLLVEGVQDYAIYMLSPDGIVTSWNLGAYRIKGYDASEIIGHHFSRFFTREDIEASKPWNELAIAREAGRVEDQGWRIRKDGTRFWARIMLTSLYDAEGRLRGFAKVTQDMTRSRHVEMLEATSRRLMEFIAVLAHELRNPLAPIRNAAILLQHTPRTDSEFHDLCRMIDRQSGHLSRIVDDLIDLSRITRGSFEIRKARTDMADVLTRAVEGARPVIAARGHSLRVTLPTDSAHVDGDAIRLTQVFTNILNNAARYTPSGGTIVMNARTEQFDGNTQVVVSVKDTGRGIEAELLGSIFGMFVQGRDALARVGGGLGVGLALARNIVELHHGTIEAMSEGIGKGSEFIVRLPLTDAGVVHEGVHSTPISGVGTVRRVLVVDDNVDAAEILAVILKHLGHEVRIVHDGSGAIVAAEDFRPDVVLLDLGMPGLDGFEVARRLRERKGSPRLTIVAVTGWDRPEDHARTSAAGFDMHLVKPVEETQLRHVLEASPPALN